MSYYKKFNTVGLLATPPSFINDNIILEAKVGSHGYGTNGLDSDVDMYAICVPPRELAWPFLFTDAQPDFGTLPQTFDQYHPAKFVYGNMEYEIKVYNIRRLLHLAMFCNPREIEFLFSSDDSVTFETPVGKLIRDNKALFLHKGFYNKFVSFGESQLAKMDHHKTQGVRKSLHETYGFDTKFASHCIRLILQSEQILESGNLDLKKHAALLRSIRGGSLSRDEIIDLFNEKKAKCEKLFAASQLPERPNELLIREFALRCCEQHWRDHE